MHTLKRTLVDSIEKVEKFRPQRVRLALFVHYTVLLFGWIVGSSACSLLAMQPQEPPDLASLIEKTKGDISRCWLAGGVPNSTQQWETTDAIVIQGQVIEINDRELIYIPVDKRDSVRSNPSDKNGSSFEGRPVRSIGDQVVAMEIKWGSEPAEKAHRLFEEGKYAEAVTTAQKGLSSGILKWQQRVLVSEMVYSLRALGRLGPSGDVFLKLAKEHPPILHYSSIPLVWLNPRIDKSATDFAKKWIGEEDESAKLLGASWLLAGSDRADAMVALEALTKSRSPAIQKLATAQLWRTVPAAEVPSQRLGDWSTMRDSMPQPLQWGPTLLIADKLQQAGKPELAIAEWIRFAVLHPNLPIEKGECLEKAKKVFLEMKMPEEATKLDKFK